MMERLPPRLWSIALTVLMTLWVLEDISRQVAFQFSTLCIAPLFYLLLLGNYAFRLAAAPPPMTMEEECESTWRWFVLPVALGIIFSACMYPWPMTCRFVLSREAFERKVAEVQQNRSDQEPQQGPQRVGLYWVERIEVRSGEYVMFVTGASLIDPVGFAYDPSRPPSSPYNRHIVGDWYATEW